MPVSLKYYDLSNTNNIVLVDDQGKNKYLAHPDLLSLDDGKKLVAFYVNGHGKGETIVKTSSDYGKTWSKRRTDLPNSFKNTEETPTIFTLNFNNGKKKYLLISARPGWNAKNKKGEGFDISLSDDGINYSEHVNYFGPNAKQEEYRRKKGVWNPIVAFSTMHKIANEDAWYGYFHDYDFIIYRIKITFKDNKLVLSEPEKVFEKYRSIEKKHKFSEVQIFKTKNKDQMMMLIRTEARNSNSYYAISNDNGKTFLEPKELPNHITGDRHKVFFTSDNKIVIFFRKIDYYQNFMNIKSKFYMYSHGLMMFIANDINDIINPEHHGYLVKLGHTYIKNSGGINYLANPDTGYTGAYIDKNDKLVVISYGKFKKDDRKNTCIVAFHLDLKKVIEDIKTNKFLLQTK